MPPTGAEKKKIVYFYNDREILCEKQEILNKQFVPFCAEKRHCGQNVQICRTPTKKRGRNARKCVYFFENGAHYLQINR
ncbi:MAG: hypothetical protein EGP89_02030 [Ruminococcaceae bacterium]|nr:hypothetical protein [Oscillospiraceae bacterium]